MNYQPILERIHTELAPWIGQGRVADYIPELAKVPADKFGMAVVTLDGNVCTVGDAQERFSIQSISKLFACTLAFQLLGDALWERVGREPSGTAFNSLVQLESERGKPRNPFINAGALVVTDVLCRRFVKAETALVEFVRRLIGANDIDYDSRVALSELQHAERNRAMAHFMASFGNMEMPPETVVEAYCRQCAITMNCVELARAALFLANGGVAPATGDRRADRRSEFGETAVGADAHVRHVRCGRRFRLSRRAAGEERRRRRDRRGAARRDGGLRVGAGARCERQFVGGDVGVGVVDDVFGAVDLLKHRSQARLVWRDGGRFLSARARALNGEFCHRQQSTQSRPSPHRTCPVGL